MRNIKTAVAVCICVVISHSLRLEYPFYACIAAVISLDSSLTASYRAGKNRVLATFVGAGIGLLCALIRPDNAVLCGIGIVAVIFMCNLLKWRKATATAGIVFLAIMLNLRGHNPTLYSINRIVDTIIGVVVAGVVNYTIVPPHQVEVVAKMSRQLFDECRQTIEDCLINRTLENMGNLERAVAAFNTKLSALCADHRMVGKKHAGIQYLKKTLELSEQILRHIKFIEEVALSEELKLSRENVEKLHELFNLSEEVKEAVLHCENEVIVNYHAGKMLDCLKELNKILPLASA